MCCSKRFVFSCVSFTFSDSFLFGGGIVYLFNGSRPFFSILLWLSRAHCVRTHMQRRRRRRWRCQSFAAYSCYFSLSLFVIRPILCKSEPGAPPEHILPPPPLPPTNFEYVIGLCVYGSDVDNDGSKMERKQKKCCVCFYANALLYDVCTCDTFEHTTGVRNRNHIETKVKERAK